MDRENIPHKNMPHKNMPHKNIILKPGLTFLEEHRGIQVKNNIPSDHIVVDKSDWEKVISFFNNHPNEFDKMIGNSTVVGKYPSDDNEMEVSL